MSDSTVGLLASLIIVSISLLLSHFVSPYFYIVSIPLLLFFIYTVMEELFPSLIKFRKSLFQKNYPDLINENGLNETYFKNKKKKILKERFYTKDSIRHGKYESFYLDGITVSITANYINGKLHGECKKWSILNPFGGGCYRDIEKYDHGELRHQKFYFTGSSKPLDTITKTRTLSKETNFELGNSEIGSIREDISGRKDV
tara:strand:- start:57 stop:659 length:603 start_codon:yes stop_codon:yes gene_type:complete